MDFNAAPPSPAPFTGTLASRAPAKVNLTLRVARRRADGYHDLTSLVVFAGTGDLLTLTPDAPLGLHVTGPTAEAAGAESDNLVLKAARAFCARFPHARLGGFSLVKRLPVAAGLGGGSSDAAAALRLLARLNGVALDDPGLFAAAKASGADVPVCLDPKARVMMGIGDVLSAPVSVPPLAAVLVNCRAVVPTPQVFRGLGLVAGEDLPGPAHPAGADAWPAGRAAFLAQIAALPNDLEPPACAYAPQIKEVRRLLAQAPETRLARMSGSGATVFALADDCRAAAALARRIAAAHPDWWVKPTLLR